MGVVRQCAQPFSWNVLYGFDFEYVELIWFIVTYGVTFSHQCYTPSIQIIICFDEDGAFYNDLEQSTMYNSLRFWNDDWLTECEFDWICPSFALAFDIRAIEFPFELNRI